MPACTLCIVRRLHYIATFTTVTTTKSEVRRRIRLAAAQGHQTIKYIQPFWQKRREMIIDLLITIGIPVLQMGLGKRFIYLFISPP